MDLFRFPILDLNHPYNVNYLGTKRILSAMKIQKVRKLVRITGSLIGKSSILFPVVLFNLLLSMSPKWHERSEIAVRRSCLDYTVIRPTEIVAEAAARDSGRSLVLLHGDTGERAPLPGKVSISDVSDICVNAALNHNVLCNTSVIISSTVGAGTRETLWEKLIPKVC
jgi:hypothetical protein